MTLKPEEVSWVIGNEIEKYEERSELESVGRVIQVGDGIARIWGLDDVMMSELLEFPNGTLGMVLNLAVDHVGAVLLGSEQGIKEHDVVKRTNKIISVPVGEASPTGTEMILLVLLTTSCSLIPCSEPNRTAPT